MRRFQLTILFLLTTVTFCGCIPEKKIIWSPDGRTAAIIGGDGLYLCDESGKLSSHIAEMVKEALWLSDSKQLLVIRGEPLQVLAERCVACQACMNIGCPAISWTDAWHDGHHQVSIDSDACMGCSICAQLCTADAIVNLEQGPG